VRVFRFTVEGSGFRVHGSQFKVGKEEIKF